MKKFVLKITNNRDKLNALVSNYSKLNRYSVFPKLVYSNEAMGYWVEEFTPSTNMEYWNLADYAEQIVDMLYLMNKQIRYDRNSFNRTFKHCLEEAHAHLLHTSPRPSDSLQLRFPEELEWLNGQIAPCLELFAS